MLMQPLYLLVLLCFIQGLRGTPPLSLGSSFYLPSQSLTEELHKGFQIFSTIPSKCVVNYTLHTNAEEMHHYKSAQDFYIMSAKSVGLHSDQALPHTFYSTLVTASESIDTTQMAVMGNVIEISILSKSYELAEDCVHNIPLLSSFEKAFKALPDRVDKPYDKSSWESFKVFLDTYGTHYQSHVKYGSMILEYVFAQHSRGYSTRQMLVEVCKRYRYVDMGLCESVSQADYDNAPRLIASNYFTVRGGNSTTTAAIMSSMTQRNLEQFLQQAPTHHQPIKMVVKPIWEMLKKRFIGSKHFNKALTLEQYYTGYVAHGCSYIKHNGVVLRQFAVLKDEAGIVEYGCKLRNPGCNTDSDCHLGTMSWSCFCYGNTCVDKASHFNSKLGVIPSREMRSSEKGSTWEGVNLSCRYQFGPSCYCDHSSAGWDTTWPADEGDFRHDVLIYRQLYRTLNNGALGAANGAGTTALLLIITLCSTVVGLRGCIIF